LINSCYK